ncbi:MAG: PQQ-binding-like beta-propeller repeat protein [Acidobacteriota bacterium]|nr:PQQ-binding-like beta-propeller repeat protein [Acidobacteriota bacterium]
MKKLTIVILCCLSFSFCSLFQRKISSYPTGLIFPLQKKLEFVCPGEIIERILKEGEQVYFSTSKGTLYCVDMQSLEALWTFHAKSTLVSPPFMGDRQIFVLDDNNTIYCLDKEGKLIWEREIDEKITSQIAASEKHVYFGSEKGAFLALDASTGEELWRFRAEGAILSNPVVSGAMVIFGCEDQYLYLLSQFGKLKNKFKANGAIRTSIQVDGKFCYFASEGDYFYCFDIINGKKKWEVKAGGSAKTPPLVDQQKVYFLSWNSVLYCLNKKNGTILWWKIVPSRSLYRLELVEDKIVVSSLSSIVVCFDKKTGEKRGSFDATLQVKSNPLWWPPYLLVNVYDREQDSGHLIYLEKEVKVSIVPSKKSPQPVNEEIIFTASSTGFFMPRYEFSLKEGETLKIIQESFERNTWVWYPEKPGVYIIGVKAIDDKESAQTEVSFTIEAKKTEEENKEKENSIKTIKKESES